MLRWVLPPPFHNVHIEPAAGVSRNDFLEPGNGIEQIPHVKGKPQKNGFIWINWPKLVNPPQDFYIYREFTRNFRQKGVKYATKTVIYKSLGPLDPTHTHLGQLTQKKSFLEFFFLAYISEF